MDDEVWKRDEIDSPCVKICVIHEDSGLCIGCHRSRDEIASWSRLSPAKRGEIMAALPARAPLIRSRRRKRRGLRD